MENILKKNNLIFLVLVLLLVFSLNVGAEAEKFEIGISQFVEHPSLDLARKGFIDQLAEKGYLEGKNLKIEFQNAQADFATAQSIAQRFKQNNLDLILAIATPAAQTAVNVLSNTPVLITAVTDPVAAGIVANMDQPGKNISGTTDMNPVAKQLELIQKFLPKIKNLGILYNPGEVNSTVQVRIAKQKAKEMKIELKEATVSNSSEVSLAVSSLIGKVEAIYVPTDNIIVSAMPTVLETAYNNQIPVFTSENNSVKQGAIATLGIDYYKLGKQTGLMAAKIFAGENISQMSIESSNDLNLYLNKKTANQIGLEIPESILNNADTIFE